MSAVLLREYITLMVERIHTKKGLKDDAGGRFDINKFKSIKNAEMAFVYARKYLTMLGQGSSRAALLLSSKYALKIALNSKGIAQNEAEVGVYTNPKSQPIVAKIYDYDDDYSWLICDLVKPLRSVDEFKQLTGIDWRSFSEYINNGIPAGQIPKGAPPFVKAILSTALKNDMLRGDLAQQNFEKEPTKDVLDHYGKTPDGRLVLLDYGATREVWDNHYKKARELPQGKTAKSGDKTVTPGETSDLSPSKSREKTKKDIAIDREEKTAAPKNRIAANDREEKTKRA